MLVRIVKDGLSASEWHSADWNSLCAFLLYYSFSPYAQRFAGPPSPVFLSIGFSANDSDYVES